MSREERIARRWTISHQTPYSSHIFSTQLYTKDYHFVSTIFHSPNYHPNQTHYKCQKLLVHFFILTSLNLCRNWREHTFFFFFLCLKSPKEKKWNPFLPSLFHVSKGNRKKNQYKVLRNIVFEGKSLVINLVVANSYISH